jgi:hypothetical protein
MAVRYGNLPFREQIDYLRQKVAIPTRAWTDIYGSEHDHAFMVAGANRMAIVEDFQRSVLKAIENGGTLQDFRKDFDKIVERHGWSYNGSRGWRTRVIYETNLMQSYNAGREAQMADPELRRLRPYGLYRHGGSENPRPEHLANDGMVVPLDDAWWQRWTPKNGWGCTCKKYMISREEAERRGYTVLEQGPDIEYEEKVVGANGPSPRTVRVPKGIDPGFEHRPGAGRVRGVTPPQMDSPLRGTTGPFPRRPASDPMPEARTFADDLPSQAEDTPAAVDRFLGVFGARRDGQMMRFEDPMGEPLPISDALFLAADDTWQLPAGTDGRYMGVLANALRDPDEIWVAAELPGDGKRPVLRRRYLARFALPGDEGTAVAIFEWGRDGWAGITTTDEQAAELDRLRQGVRLYRRGEDD